ncbi:hypothetical protein CPLU01_02754 [Colletotrichum plurivorum]|uniref:Uncharacterized protein n=1 Tax=Colletotrichum plurivorum TaxID=2175906 RepID=A0A8H6KV39_9PEZI|nr:hypothetical protein CPLU01_02754 [Colletotrichum plurivorum]
MFVRSAEVQVQPQRYQRIVRFSCRCVHVSKQGQVAPSNGPKAVPDFGQQSPAGKGPEVAVWCRLDSREAGAIDMDGSYMGGSSQWEDANSLCSKDVAEAGSSSLGRHRCRWYKEAVDERSALGTIQFLPSRLSRMSSVARWPSRHGDFLILVQPRCFESHQCRRRATYWAAAPSSNKREMQSTVHSDAGRLLTAAPAASERSGKCDEPVPRAGADGGSSGVPWPELPAGRCEGRKGPDVLPRYERAQHLHTSQQQQQHGRCGSKVKSGGKGAPTGLARRRNLLDGETVVVRCTAAARRSPIAITVWHFPA